MKRILSVFVKSQTPPVLPPLKSPEGMTQEERLSLLLPVARALYRFSPVIAFDDFSREEKCGERVRGMSRRLHEQSDPWSLGINLDLSGTERLFSSDNELLRKIGETIAFHGFLSRLSIAPTLGMSWAYSRFGKQRVSVICQNTLKQEAEKLPVSAFRLSRQELSALAELEIRTGAQLFHLPRSALLERFGSGILKRIDQVLGRAEEPLPKCRISFSLACSKEFDVPVENAAALSFQAQVLLEEFVKKMKDSHQRLLVFRLELLSGERQSLQKDFRLSASSVDTTYLWQLIEPFFEKLAVSGGVKQLSFRSLGTEPQLRLQLPSEHTRGQSFAQLLDVIAEHLGPEDVKQVACFPSHLPERSFAYVPRGAAVLDNNVQPQHCEERPSFLFYKPSPLKVIAPLPDGPPAWLEWKERRYRVSQAIGPERIAPPWWGEDAERFQTKDYFRVQVPTGSWLWIYRESTRWYVHGIWT